LQINNRKTENNKLVVFLYRNSESFQNKANGSIKILSKAITYRYSPKCERFVFETSKHCWKKPKI
jgi:hypothetical protein